MASDPLQIDPFVCITSVTKLFWGNEKPALKNVSAAFARGKMTGLVGPDGAGKTTLMRLMTGLLLPNTGSVVVGGFDTRKNAPSIHKILGYMPQKFGLYEDLTVIQNLNLYAALRNVKDEDREKRFERLLAFAGLEPFQKRLAAKLSGGMKQKLGLACALIGDPELLLLDEPTVGVDPISRRELWKMVQELLHEGICAVWSTSYLDEAEKCDSVVLLHDGLKLHDGPPQDLADKMGGQTHPRPRFWFEKAFMKALGGAPTGISQIAADMQTKPKDDQPVIEAKNLTKHFGDFVAVNNQNFTIQRGEIFGLLGPNGAGKSTIFKMLCGLLQPTEGEASVIGLNLKTATSEARSRIGYMAQKFSLYGNLSVMQNLKFFSGLYGLSHKKQKEKIALMVDLFNLQGHLKKNALELPLGFKQRLSLACAVMHEPDILFLDEPTSGVDPITRLEFWMHIESMVKKGVTVMVTTHFMSEAEHCDRISLIYNGESIATGTPDELKDAVKTTEMPQPTLDDVFVTLVQKSISAPGKGH